MLELIVSLALLAFAPLLDLLSRRFAFAGGLVHRLLVILVAVLVVLHLLPESIHELGVWAAVIAFVGLVLPTALEHLWHAGAQSVHRSTVVLAVVGLFVHGMLDGAALALPREGVGLMQLAVLAHRLPAAILVWSLFYPERGKVVPALMLGALGLATVVGYAAGAAWMHELHHSAALHVFQALVSGSLLHVAFDRR